ncbi:T9SS type A sorting domain-containing protein, partial [bacterium]|nr:T9SS type A sorting domain-containing protein [bacterium]
YNFSANTHFVKQGTTWSNIENLVPVFGEIIPMIRCFVEPIQTLQAKLIMPKTQNSQTITWQVLSYNLYKLNGQASSANDVLASGTQIYSGLSLEFEDLQVADSSFYSYTVTTTYDVNGTALTSEANNLAVVFTGDLLISVGKNENKKITYKLSQNFPNPFNPSTKITYELPQKGQAKLIIFNILGERVKDFELEQTKNFVVWNGTDFSGNLVSSGVYFYRLESGNFSQTKKMLLLR